MRLETGETLVARIKGSVPAPDSRVVRDGTVVAQFWAPGRNPRESWADRTTPDHDAACTFDDRSRSWVARISTEGWSPGVWTARGLLRTLLDDGEPLTGWDWATFEIVA